jgi:hypothetical protein
MKRRVFIKSGAVAAGLLGTLKPFPLSATADGISPNPLQTPNQFLKQSGLSQKDIRSADYLNSIRAYKYYPKCRYLPNQN